MAFMDFLPQFGDNTDQSGLEDPTLQAINLKRKLALADSLRNTPELQGQMVSGRYVAPAWTQSLANVANKYIGNKISENAMKEYGTTQKAKEQKMADALKGFVEGMSPATETTSVDNFVNKPLEQGMNVPTSPFGTSEQVGQTSPYNTQNMSGDMSINQPVQTTTQRPRTQQELINNFYNFAQKSNNPDIANKFALEQFGEAIKPKTSTWEKVGDNLVEFDYNKQPTGNIKTFANDLELKKFQETQNQHKIENEINRGKLQVEKDKADPLGLNRVNKPNAMPQFYTEQDVKDTAISTGKSEQQVRQDLIAKGWKAR